MSTAAALKLYRDAEARQGQEGSRKRWRLASHALALQTSDAAGQIAYARACTTHKRADWREAARLLAMALDGGAVRAMPVKREKAPETLCEFLSRRGGVKDEGGELKAMDAHLWHRDAPFRRRLVTESGMTYDEACDAAHDAGYFDDIPFPSWDSSDNMHGVSPDQLMAAINRELMGRHVFPYAPGNDDWREAA